MKAILRFQLLLFLALINADELFAQWQSIGPFGSGYNTILKFDPWSAGMLFASGDGHLVSGPKCDLRVRRHSPRHIGLVDPAGHRGAGGRAGHALRSTRLGGPEDGKQEGRERDDSVRGPHAKASCICN